MYSCTLLVVLQAQRPHRAAKASARAEAASARTGPNLGSEIESRTISAAPAVPRQHRAGAPHQGLLLGAATTQRAPAAQTPVTAAPAPQTRVGTAAPAAGAPGIGVPPMRSGLDTDG